MDDIKKKELSSESIEKQKSEKNLCGCLVVDECGCIENACEYEASACTCYLDPCACQF
jgi:hypothetical protein